MYARATATSCKNLPCVWTVRDGPYMHESSKVPHLTAHLHAPTCLSVCVAAVLSHAHIPVVTSDQDLGTTCYTCAQRSLNKAGHGPWLPQPAISSPGPHIIEHSLCTGGLDMPLNVDQGLVRLVLCRRTL